MQIQHVQSNPTASNLNGSFLLGPLGKFKKSAAFGITQRSRQDANYKFPRSAITKYRLLEVGMSQTAGLSYRTGNLS